MSKKNLVVLDTNVFIRFLIADHEELYERAKTIFSKIENDQISAILLESVFAEIIFVLEKNYEVEREKITTLMSKILDLRGLENPNKPIYQKALQVYQSKNIDIVDCLIAAYSVLNDIEEQSFDQDIKKAKQIIKNME